MSIFEINTLTPAEIREEMQRAITLKKRHFHFRHQLADGEVQEVEVYSGPILFNGRRALYSCIFDVSDRKKSRKGDPGK